MKIAIVVAVVGIVAAIVLIVRWLAGDDLVVCIKPEDGRD